MSVQEQIDRLITQRAAEWFEVVRTGQSEKFPDFVQWATESPRHLEEFLAITALAPSIGQAARKAALERSIPMEPAELPVTRPVIPLRGEQSAGVPAARERASRWRWRPIAAAAAMVVAILVFYHLTSAQHYSTGIGEQRMVQLPDGSMMELNAQSEAVVRFRDSERGIQLKSGDALFKVARDARRPFRVRSGIAVVEAVGTQFAVSARRDGIQTVSVLEGKVLVSGNGPSRISQTPAETASVAITAGEQAQVADDGQIARESTADVQSAVAWLRREMVFDHAPLEEVINEFNRHNQTRRFRVEGVKAGLHHYSGTFRVDDPESLADFLAGSDDLQVSKSEQEIVIRSR